MDVFHNSRSNTLACSQITHSTARPLSTPKMPFWNVLLYSCHVPCSSHPTHSWPHEPKCMCVCKGEHVLFLFSFAVSCMNVFPGDPVKGKAALPRWSVRGPWQASPSWPCYCLFLRCTRAHLLSPSLSSSLHPLAHTDNHKMFLGEGSTAMCLRLHSQRQMCKFRVK